MDLVYCVIHQKHKKKSLWKDHALEDDLAAMGLRAKSMESDGNCFFRALGDQLYVSFLEQGIASEFSCLISRCAKCGNLVSMVNLTLVWLVDRGMKRGT